MADPERENSYYYPAGVPVTPQATRFGYNFPVYVSKLVFNSVCVADGIPSKHNASTDQRIWKLLEACYEGMTKRLTQEETFLWYTFKIFYWNRKRKAATKMQSGKLAARLFLDPETGGPWLYIYVPNVDGVDDLEAGEAPADEPDFAPKTGEEA